MMALRRETIHPAPNRLRRLRGDRPLHEMADKAAISPAMLSYMERGRRTGTPKVRHALVRALRDATGDRFLAYEDVFPAAMEAAYFGYHNDTRSTT
jgi:hypothetical protein